MEGELIMKEDKIKSKIKDVLKAWTNFEFVTTSCNAGRKYNKMEKAIKALKETVKPDMPTLKNLCLDGCWIENCILKECSLENCREMEKVEV